jgi:hypothetical protein
LLFLWKKLGFSIVGTLPKAFRHKRLGYIDAYVMYELLQDPDHCPIADDAPGGRPALPMPLQAPGSGHEAATI